MLRNPLKTGLSHSSVQSIHSVVSDSLRSHGQQRARLPCPSPTPGAYSNSWPSSPWCNPAISSSLICFSSYPQTFQHKGLFQWVVSLNEVEKYWSVSFSISPSNEYSGLIFPFGLTGLIALQSKGPLRVFSAVIVKNVKNSH